jgi:hypothetical protein
MLQCVKSHRLQPRHITSSFYLEQFLGNNNGTEVTCVIHKSQDLVMSLSNCPP